MGMRIYTDTSVFNPGDHVNVGSEEVPTRGTVRRVYLKEENGMRRVLAEIELASGVVITRRVRSLTKCSVLDVLAQAAVPPSEESPL